MFDWFLLTVAFAEPSEALRPFMAEITHVASYDSTSIVLNEMMQDQMSLPESSTAASRFPRFQSLFDGAEESVDIRVGRLSFWKDGRIERVSLVTPVGPDVFARFLEAERSLRPNAEIHADGDGFRIVAPRSQIASEGVSGTIEYADICYRFDQGFVFIGDECALQILAADLDAELKEVQAADSLRMFRPDRIPESVRATLLQHYVSLLSVHQQRQDHEQPESVEYLLRKTRFESLEDLVRCLYLDSVRIEAGYVLPKRQEEEFRFFAQLRVSPKSDSAKLLRDVRLGTQSSFQGAKTSIARMHAHFGIPPRYRDAIAAAIESWLGKTNRIGRALQETVLEGKLTGFAEVTASAQDQPYLKAGIHVVRDHLTPGEIAESIGSLSEAPEYVFTWENGVSLTTRTQLTDHLLSSTISPTDVGVIDQTAGDVSKTVSGGTILEIEIDLAKWSQHSLDAQTNGVLAQLIQFLDESFPSRSFPRSRKADSRIVERFSGVPMLPRGDNPGQNWVARAEIKISNAGDVADFQLTVGSQLYAWLVAAGFEQRAMLKPSVRHKVKLNRSSIE